MTGRAVVVSAAVVSSDPETITRVLEVFARAVAGLALEGVDAYLEAGAPERDDEDETEDEPTG